MTITLILIVLAVVALVVGWSALRAGRSGRARNLRGELQPIDLEAFLNLVNPEEEDFLKSNLPPAEFRAIHRERLWAAVEYVSGVSENAATLLKIGAVARRSSDVQVAEAGQRLTDRASRLRVQALKVKAKLYLGVALPGVALNPAAVVDGYRQINDLAMQLGRIREPRPARVG